MSLHIATDVGGTFTDLVLFEHEMETLKSRLLTLKVDTTPPDFDRGVLLALQKSGVALSEVDLLAHGATVVINALTERRGARTALVTTAGFRDVLEIARGNRPDLFNLNYVKPVAFVERHLRFEVAERVTYSGEIVLQPDLGSLDALASRMREADVKAVAVCCLHAYKNSANEAAIAKELRRLLPELPVVASNEISREWREYERTNTTVASAYVSPMVRTYISALREGLGKQGFLGSLYLMQSNGGMTSAEGAIANPVSMVESGPASGMLAAQAVGLLIGEPNVIALDVGGTTAKCTLIRAGQLPVTTEYHIERTATHPGYPIQTAVIDLVEIGQGGGSIASVDAGNRLCVGPKSAGAKPGPVAYGRGGTQPTVTDANLLLGRIDSARFLSGQVEPDLDAVRSAFERLGSPIGLNALDAARGVIRLSNSNMVNALKLVSTNRGFDPREFSLMAFGGGGALHAMELAEELRIPRVIVPMHAAVFSAWGMLLTDIRRDYTLTNLGKLRSDEESRIDATFDGMQQHAKEDFEAQSMNAAEIRFTHFLDLRYEGQEHTVKVPADTSGSSGESRINAIRDQFHSDHESRYTFRLPDAAVEIVNYHLVAKVHVPKPQPQLRQPTSKLVGDALLCKREVFFEHHGVLNASVYDGGELEAGMALSGPAIIQDNASSLVLPPNHRLSVDSYGNLVIDLSFEALEQLA